MTGRVRRAVRLEHRLTQPTATLADLDSAAALAVEHELAALTVTPWLVKAAKRALSQSRVSVGTVIAYPHGTSMPGVKAQEASTALDQGATQLDFVLNAGALVAADDDALYRDMLAVVDMAHSGMAAAGVILEPVPLPDEAVRRACRLAERAGADYVVTGIGADEVSRTVQRTRLLRDAVGPRIGVKAAGRFASVDEIDEVMGAGATRVATELSADLASRATGELAGAGAAH